MNNYEKNKEYAERYRSANTSRIVINTKKTEKAEWQAFSESKNIQLATLIRELMSREMGGIVMLNEMIRRFENAGYPVISFRNETYNADAATVYVMGQKIYLYKIGTVLGSNIVTTEFSRTSVRNMFELINNITPDSYVYRECDEDIEIYKWGKIINATPDTFSNMKIYKGKITEQIEEEIDVYSVFIQHK